MKKPPGPDGHLAKAGLARRIARSSKKMTELEAALGNESAKYHEMCAQAHLDGIKIPKSSLTNPFFRDGRYIGASTLQRIHDTRVALEHKRRRLGLSERDYLKYVERTLGIKRR